MSVNSISNTSNKPPVEKTKPSAPPKTDKVEARRDYDRARETTRAADNEHGKVGRNLNERA